MCFLCVKQYLLIKSKNPVYLSEYCLLSVNRRGVFTVFFKDIPVKSLFFAS